MQLAARGTAIIQRNKRHRPVTATSPKPLTRRRGGFDQRGAQALGVGDAGLGRGQFTALTNWG